MNTTYSPYMFNICLSVGGVDHQGVNLDFFASEAANDKRLNFPGKIPILIPLKSDVADVSRGLRGSWGREDLSPWWYVSAGMRDCQGCPSPGISPEFLCFSRCDFECAGAPRVVSTSPRSFQESCSWWLCQSGQSLPCYPKPQLRGFLQSREWQFFFQ